MEVRTIRRYGWIPDRPDHRDVMLERTVHTSLIHIDLSSDPANPVIWDQSRLGSCTSHGVGRCAVFARSKSTKTPPETPSRLWIYFKSRLLEGTVPSDSGASVRDAFKVVCQLGFPPEQLWPYSLTKYAITPPTSVDQAAKKDRVLKYRRVAYGCPSLQHLKDCLAYGLPVAFGFSVFESFEGIGSDGKMPMPGTRESALGGHCVAAVGFDDATGYVKCANSWGFLWGDQGYFYMPYEYITVKYCADFWQAEVAN